MNVFGFFAGLAKRAFGFAKANGLNDDLVKLALKWVRIASEKTVDNAEKREWCVEILKAKGIPESVARIAIELGFQLYKAEIKSRLSKSGNS